MRASKIVTQQFHYAPPATIVTIAVIGVRAWISARVAFPSLLPGISELMKRELESRVRAVSRFRKPRRGGGRHRCSVPASTRRQEEAGRTFVEDKKEREKEREKRPGTRARAKRVRGRNLINLFIKRFSCLCWGWRIPTGNTRRLNESTVDRRKRE